MFELTLLTVAHSAEAVSDALLDEHGALSVSVEDAEAGTEAERPLFGEPGMPADETGWSRALIKALFCDAESAGRAAALLRMTVDAAVQVHSLQPVADQDWVRLTQSQFTPTEVAPGFWVVPSWHEPPTAATTVIRLDPGMAFGTGTHPTTRMCLRWIARHAPLCHGGWPRVLDYGCGSGILGIGAALFGGRGVEAVDIDPEAVKAAAANAEANGVVLKAGLPELAAGAYSLILANILATPLKVLAPLLCAHLATRGALILAGILERQTDELVAAYRPWLELHVSDREDGWVLLAGQRSAADAGDAPAATRMA